MLTVKLMFKLVNREDKAHFLVQIIKFENIMNNGHDMQIKFDNLPSSKFLNIPLA
jgi:hypothetical protein